MGVKRHRHNWVFTGFNGIPDGERTEYYVCLICEKTKRIKVSFAGKKMASEVATPPPAPAVAKPATCPGQAGRQAGKNPSCPQDNMRPGDIQGWVRVLTAEIVGHNVQGVVLRRFGNRTEICFALKDGSKYEQPTRCDMAVAWMIENRVLARGDFFARCPIAKNSAALHHQALRRMENMNLIERLSWGWVWKD